MDVTHYRRLLRERFAGRSLVLVGMSRTRLAPVVAALPGLGAKAVFAISGNADGEVPLDGPAVRWWSFGFSGRDQHELDGRFDAALRDPPADLVRALAAFDPAHEAWVLDSRDLPDVTFAGRRRFGWRRPQWAIVEDKVRVQEVWQRAGIAHAPALVVPARPDAVTDAARRLDTGTGTVWTADARDGLHAGAVATRWVCDDRQAADALSALLPRSDRIRVMPFLDGLPCSIHGLVCADAVIALRPLELLTLRRPDGRFQFAGTSTFWDCPDEAGRELRAVTRRIGAALRELVGYRGGFTVDGVLSEGGFRPTEVNARLGSGLNINQTRPELQFFLLNRLLQEDATVDIRPAYLEAVVNEALGHTREARAKTPLCRPANEYATLALRRDGIGWAEASGAPATLTTDARLTVEPSDKGDQAVFLPEATPFRGRAMAPWAVAAFAFAEKVLTVEVGPLRPAVGFG